MGSLCSSEALSSLDFQDATLPCFLRPSGCFLYLPCWVIGLLDIWLLKRSRAQSLNFCSFISVLIPWLISSSLLALNTTIYSQAYIPSPDFSHRLRIHIVNFRLDISTWMFNRHFKLNISLKMSSWNLPHPLKHASLSTIPPFHSSSCPGRIPDSFPTASLLANPICSTFKTYPEFHYFSPNPWPRFQSKPPSAFALIIVTVS